MKVRCVYYFFIFTCSFLICSCHNPFYQKDTDDKPFRPPATTEVTLIAEAAITVTAPVKGGTPATTIGGEDNFTLSAISWEPEDSPFAGLTEYTVTVTLTANEDFAFADDCTATVNTQAVAVSANTGDTVTVSYPFGATLGIDITGIAVKTQPTLAYTHGDSLDLSLLVVTLTIDDHGVIGTEDVMFADFDDYGSGISTNFADGLTLSHTDHDGKKITVSFDSLQAETNALTVGKANPTYTAPVALTATYGQTLANVTLPTGFAWEDATATSVGNVGTNSFNVTFTPSDTANYNTLTGISVSITVGKASGAAVSGAPTVNGTPTPDSITVNTVTIPTNPGSQSVEYAILYGSQVLADATWYSATTAGAVTFNAGTVTFIGLSPDTTYYAYARSASTANYTAGTASSASAGITTLIEQSVPINFNFIMAGVDIVMPWDDPALADALEITHNGDDTTTLMLDISGTYDAGSVKWYIDGILQSSSNGDSSYTLDSEDYSNFDAGGDPIGIGIHSLTVEVTVDGIPYSRTIEFEVR
ncbi:MAG: hypothetical protein FWD36_10110 [Treponema sp.]|nr:hypothetical protein [Treponema sp.]